ncbi:hypothetical protein ACQKNX_11510 [Lysinibacillus sp. NPDC093712]|uniref:hypothetical protein n=1 Tax=Lysinibacillus sp. NPDC093712 TaxID=3390579 RepID=UPI003CFFC21F
MGVATEALGFKKMMGVKNVNIQEATRIALNEGLFITREIQGFEHFRIQPTNTDDCYIVHISKDYIGQVGEKYIPGKRWNPKA